MVVITITGDVGAGKSTAANLLSEKLDCNYFNADNIAKSIWNLEYVKKAAVSRWGSSILDESNNILKSKIASIIFNNKSENQWCNNLIHPLVFNELHKIVNKEIALNKKFLVLEIPLLFESSCPDWIDYIIFVTAPLESRIKRRQAQSNWTRQEFLKRENFFIDSSLKISKSNFIIENNYDISDLNNTLDKIILKIYTQKEKKIFSK